MKEKDTSIVSTCSATTNQADYLSKYMAIVSLEQRQHYKDDFNAEYEEYRNLHSQIDKINKNFRQFLEQWKSLIPGSEASQVKKDKTVKTVLHHSGALNSLELLSETKGNCRIGIYAQTLLGLGLIFARPCPKALV
ncbi:RNA polymerase II elongation factor ELL-like [Acridotheres tristis]